MASHVSFDHVSISTGSLCFRLDDGETFFVKSLNDGIMVIEPIHFSVKTFVKKISECLGKGTIFSELKEIKFNINGMYYSITNKSSKPKEIPLSCPIKNDEFFQKIKNLKHNDFLKNEEIQFKDDVSHQIWDSFILNTKNSYCSYAVYYAENWAKSMQYLMSNDKNITVSQVADEASKIAGIEETTKFISATALNILIKVWKYGEDLNNWFLKKYNFIE